MRALSSKLIGLEWFRTVIDSPIINSWLVFGLKPLNFFLLLPLVLTRLEIGDIAAYYVLAAATGFIRMLGFGFHPSFIRILGYLVGGMSPSAIRQVMRLDEFPVVSNYEADVDSVSGFVRMMARVYVWLSVVATLVGVLCFTPLLIRPFSQLNDSEFGWIAWVAVLLLMPVALLANFYGSFLFGMNSVTILRRCEFVVGVGGIVSACLVLLFIPNLLALILAIHLWEPVKLVILKLACRRLVASDHVIHSLWRAKPDYTLLWVTWSSIWRIGLGVLLTQGLMQVSALILAQMSDAGLVASYGLTLSLLLAIFEFSKAPMVSRIPHLIRLRAIGKREEYIDCASQSMNWSYWAYIFGFTIVLFGGNVVVRELGANATLAPVSFVVLMGGALLLDRFGAMHQQIYETSNRIIMHLTASVYAVVYLSLVYVLVGRYDIYAFAIASLGGHLGFVAYYSSSKSHQAMGTTFGKFELRVSLFPAVVFVGISLLAFFF